MPELLFDWPRVVNLALSLLVLIGLAAAWGPVYSRTAPWVRFVVLAYMAETIATGMGTWQALGSPTGWHVAGYTLSLIWGVAAIVSSVIYHRRQRRPLTPPED